MYFKMTVTNRNKRSRESRDRKGSISYDGVSNIIISKKKMHEKINNNKNNINKMFCCKFHLSF